MSLCRLWNAQQESLARAVLWRRLIPALLLANAGALLLFGFFITVDGPIHVLHASQLPSPWGTPEQVSHAATYDTTAVPGWLGNHMLMLLLLLFAPEQAHTVFAVLISCALATALLAYLRARAPFSGPAALWIAPLTFCVPLLLGLFHFILAVAIAFGTAAWWESRAHSTRRRWPGLLVGLALAGWAHRGGLLLLSALLLPGLLFDAVVPRRTLEPKARVRAMATWVLLIGAFAVGILSFMTQLYGARLLTTGPSGLPDHDMLLRPLLLLDSVKEQPLVRVLGLLLLVASFCAAWGRFKAGPRACRHDVNLMLFLTFTALAWITDTPHGHGLMLAERCQWLALIMLIIWLISVAHAARGWVANVIGGAALCAIPLQGMRLIEAEASLASLEEPFALTMKARDALEPNRLTMVVMSAPDRLLQHLPAYVAIGYDGPMLAPREHLSLRNPPKDKSAKGVHPINWDPTWVMRHWRKGLPVEVEQVLFIGAEAPRAAQKHPWSVLLPGDFSPVLKNGYTCSYIRSRVE